MNKLWMIAMIFLYSSACKEIMQEKKQEAVVAQTNDTSRSVQQTENPEISDIKNVLVEDPKIITDGAYTQYYKSGKVKAKGAYLNGVRDGHWMVFYESGTLWSEADYKNGKKNGMSMVYYPNGQKRYEGTYKDDIRVGVWKYYDQNGNFLQEEMVKP